MNLILFALYHLTTTETAPSETEPNQTAEPAEKSKESFVEDAKEAAPDNVSEGRAGSSKQSPVASVHSCAVVEMEEVCNAASAILAEADLFYLHAGIATTHGQLTVYNKAATHSEDKALLTYVQATPSIDTEAKLELLGFGRTLAEGNPQCAGRPEEGARPSLTPRAPYLLRRSSCVSQNATFAAVLVHSPEEKGSATASIFEVVLNCAERTDGLVLGLLGSTANVGWNVAEKGTKSPTRSGLRFASTLRRVVKHGFTSQGVSLGLSCGPVKWGVVGTHCRKFLSASGRCVTLAGLLAESAESIHTYCLYGNLLGKASPLYAVCRPLLRPIDTWEGAGNNGGTFVIYELNADRLVDNELVVMVQDENPESTEQSWAWRNEYEVSWQAGDWKTIVAKAEGDEVAMHAASLLEHATHLRLPIHL